MLARNWGLSGDMLWLVSIIIPLWLDGPDESQRSVRHSAALAHPIYQTPR
jgi:hypothetical protein